MHSARKLIAVFTVLVFSLTTFIPTFASASSDTEMDALTDFLAMLHGSHFNTVTVAVWHCVLLMRGEYDKYGYA